MKQTRIFIADDHEVVRDGIRALLERNERFCVVGEAADGNEALVKITETEPDIVLMDISMRGGDGLSATTELKGRIPDCKIIILSMHIDIDYISACLALDVAGYVVKTHGGREVIDAIDAVECGKKFYSEEITAVILGQYKEMNRASHQKKEKPHIEVSSREKEVMMHLAQGLSNLEIAEKLFLSIRTIETHRANLMRKFDAKNSVDLINKARSQKLID